MAPSRIAFGSCNDQDRENRLWSVIESRRPSAFVWGGDAIYADRQMGLDWSEGIIPKPVLECATPQRLEKLYKYQLSNPDYQSLLGTNLTVFGTFDDHDYGCNNADMTYPYRHESGKAFVQFTNEPRHSPMAQRANHGLGVYGVKLFDFDRPEGHHLVPDVEAGIDPDLVTVAHPWPYPSSYSNNTVAVFVLDVRTHKTPWKRGSAAFQPDYEGDFLGEQQWQWFEAAIRRSRASVNVVVSGLQVHAEIFPNGNIAEAWGKYPTAQTRLFDALLQDGVEAPIIVSGDVHMTQFMRKDCMRSSIISKRRHLVEMTTSGMTHSWGSLSNPKRGHEPMFSFRDTFDNLVGSSLMRLMHYVCPWTALLTTESGRSPNRFENGGADGARKGKQFSLEKNFGELEFDFESRTVSMRTMSEDPNSPPLLSAQWKFDQLSGREPLPGTAVDTGDFGFERLNHHRHLDREWVCVNHRGHANQLRQILGHLTAGAALTVILPFPFLLPMYCLLIATGKGTRRRFRTRQRQTYESSQTAKLI